MRCNNRSAQHVLVRAGYATQGHSSTLNRINHTDGQSVTPSITQPVFQPGNPTTNQTAIQGKIIGSVYKLASYLAVLI